MRRPLVLLHGFTGHPRVWDEVLPPGTAVVPALAGHAGGPRPSSWEDELDRLAAVVAPVGPAHLVGYSLGARLALGLAVRHPPLCARLTLIGVNPGIEDDEERRVRREADERWARLLEALGLESFVRAWEDQPLFAAERRDPRRRAAQRQLRLLHRPEMLAAALRTLGLAGMPSYWPALPDLRGPLTLVVGAEDPKFRALARRLARVRPGTRVRVAARAGHNVVLERPDLVAAVLDDLGNDNHNAKELT